MRRSAANVGVFPQLVVATGLMFCWLGLATTTAWGQSRLSSPAPDYLQIAPDQAKGRKVLEEFRKTGWSLAGAYYLDFELQVLPRRGDERVVPGRLWGGRNDAGPITRVVLQPGLKDAERRLLVQVGTKSAVWSWSGAEGKVAVVDDAALYAPLAGTDLTAFDLQMPFLYWEKYTYDGVERVRESPADVFKFQAPARKNAIAGEPAAVRVYLDTQYNALVQAEELGADGRTLKTLTVLELQKVGTQYIVKTIDVRDETTRNKTQFVVTGAALNQTFSANVFEPARLADGIAPPPADQVVKIAP